MLPSAALPAHPLTTTFHNTLRHDLYRYHARVGFAAFVKAYLRQHPFRFTFWLRAAAHLRQRRDPFSKIAYLFCRLRREHYSLKYGYQIYEETRIGPGLYLGHIGAIVINPAAIIGRNVNIAIGVTIGQTNRGKLAGVPTLGDRVWVGTNAVIVGRVTIGDGALIAPNAYVNFDVPPNGVVLGNPGKIVAETGSAGYVENILLSAD